MKRLSLVAILICLPIGVWAEGFRNGDFTKGKPPWGGMNFKVEDDSTQAGNKLVALELKRDTHAFLSQEIQLKKGQLVTISYSVKASADYVGEGFERRLSRTDGWIVTAKHPAPSQEWKQIKFDFRPDSDQRVTVFQIVASNFKGKLYFDNFELVAHP